MGQIAENYQAIQDRIGLAAEKCSREASSIQLVVVTKGQPVGKINDVIQAGARVLGENYPEETHEKRVQIDQAIEWHMIGHLQSRKIKYMIEGFSMIHSIDRDEIAEKLGANLAAAGKTIPALFEVNLSGEESKGGYPAWDEKDWPALINHFIGMKNLPGLIFRGFMTMPPFSSNPEDSRPVFQKCRRLLESYWHRTGNNELSFLSMGTSLDFETAIQEGATHIRIGQAIMGERN